MTKTFVQPAREPYNLIAEYYDLEHGDFADDIEFYRQFVQVTGGPVLELGCGSGRLLLPLAADGHRVAGLDRSPAMLARAAAAAEQAGLDRLISLHAAEMSAADSIAGGPYGVVIIGLSGLLHIAGAAGQRAVLRAARNALDPRGQLLIDVLNPTAEPPRAYDRSVIHEGTWRTAAGERLDKFSARRHRAIDQIIATDLWYDVSGPDGIVNRTAVQFDMRYCYPSELALMLELEGFAEWQFYGSYDLDPLDDASERMLIAAEVTPSAAPSRSARRG